MNALTALLGIIIVILVGLIGFYFGTVKQQVSSNPAEQQQLRQEIALLQQMQPAESEPEPEPIAEQNLLELEAMKAELAALKAEQEFALQQQQALEEAAAQEEALPEVPEMDPAGEERLRRRARLVARSYVMAQVDEYFPEDGFVSIKVINPNAVLPLSKLAIRRNTGIVGQLEVTTVEGDQAIADVLSHTFLAGEIDIQPGDELIMPPL